MVNNEKKLVNTIVKVRDKGEITLPKSLRKKMELTPGMDHVVIIESENGDLQIHKLPENIINKNNGGRNK